MKKGIIYEKRRKIQETGEEKSEEERQGNLYKQEKDSQKRKEEDIKRHEENSRKRMGK